MRLLLIFSLLVSLPLSAPADEEVVTPRVTLVHLSPKDKNIEKTISDRSEKLKACHVRVEEITAANPAELESKLDLDLKNSTLVLLEGHGIRLSSNKGETIHFRWINVESEDKLPESLKKLEYIPIRSSDPALSEGLTENASILHDPNKILGLIKQKGDGAVFVDTCFAGGCAVGAVCVGTSCSYDEKSKEGNLITAKLDDLLCSAAGDCKAFNNADTNGDGCIGNFQDSCRPRVIYAA